MTVARQWGPTDSTSQMSVSVLPSPKAAAPRGMATNIVSHDESSSIAGATRRKLTAIRPMEAETHRPRWRRPILLASYAPIATATAISA